jgi:hypothetical protein
LVEQADGTLVFTATFERAWSSQRSARKSPIAEVRNM